MGFQEIVDSVRALSTQEQDSLVELIYRQREQQRGNDLWNDLQKFRNTLEQEAIFYDNIHPSYTHSQPIISSR